MIRTPSLQGFDPRPEQIHGANDDDFEWANLPSVGAPNRALPISVIILTMAALGLGLFLYLNARRLESTPPDLTAPVPTVDPVISPRVPEVGLLEPAVDEPPAPPPLEAPAQLPRVDAAALPLLQALSVPAPRPASTPVLIVDYGKGASAESTTAPAVGAALSALAPRGQGLPGARVGSLEDMAMVPGDEERVSATRLQNPSRVVPQGAIIPAVLETAIDSDLPGFARAVVSRDVLSFDGSAVLIPRGSRLIGQYKSDLTPGQSRVFVIWTRVLRPDGASIQLASPGADVLGRGGLSGQVDRRLMERMGGPVLLSMLNAGVNALSRGNSSQIIVGSPITATAGPASMGGGKQISPVVRVAQGASIRIFVARDLDFAPVSEGAGERR